MSVYLIARIKLRYGQIEPFAATMSRLVPLMEKHGWKLLGSYRHLIGDIHEFLNIWEIADANAVTAGWAAAAGEPEFPSIYAELSEEVVTEEVHLALKSPFSP